MKTLGFSSVVPFAALLVSASLPAITIDLQRDASLNARDNQALNTAKTFWETRLAGYVTDYGFVGPTLYASSGSFTPPIAGYVTMTAGFEGGVYTAQEGVLEIDAASVAALDAGGAYDAAIIRAMGHALGFGHQGLPDRLWNVNGLASSTTYTGSYALAAYMSQFNQPSATSISIAAGSDGAYGWTQAGLTNDIMSASPSALASATLSATSLAAFRDIGYTVIPEPGTWAAVAISATGLMAVRRRRRLAMSS